MSCKELPAHANKIERKLLDDMRYNNDRDDDSYENDRDWRKEKRKQRFKERKRDRKRYDRPDKYSGDDNDDYTDWEEYDYEE